MSLAFEILAELRAMFLSDARLSLGVIAVVGVASATAEFLDPGAIAPGLILLVGCLGVLVASVLRAASRPRGE